MKIEFLAAEGYRNILNSKISFSDGVNLLFGDNGAGKTNALEAVYLFSICKSFRTSREEDFITHGSDFSKISMGFCGNLYSDKARKMQIVFNRGGKKKLFYEGVEISKLSEFVGRFRSVFFTPDHLSLVKGSPDERRRFADMALSQIKPSYIKALNEYFRLLSTRNALLKQARLGEKLNNELFEVYSESLSQSAAIITRQRAFFAKSLEQYAGNLYSEISGGEGLFIRYLSSEKQNPFDLEETKNKYIKLYRENIQSEIKYGSTKYGPHKDDFLIFIGKNSNEIDGLQNKSESGDGGENENTKITEFAARSFGSQGQQRSAVLALKLAEGEIIRSLCGEYPVYLFDDVLSELDSNRKNQLMSLFCDKQVIITCCDSSSFDSKHIQNKIYVKNGCYEAFS